jgi:hypothetical protein
MTDHVYWDEWSVNERERETIMLHMKTCKGAGCTWCAEAEAIVAADAPDASDAAAMLSRADAIRKWDAPLTAAAATGDIEWVNELLAKGVDVNDFASPYEFSPLIVAAQKGQAEVVFTLLMTGLCDLKKKHCNDYIGALDSALYGYNNLDGVEAEFTPEIRAMIIRAHMETADRIDIDTLLNIEASGAVVPENIKAFRSGARMTKLYPKALPGRLDLSDPLASQIPMIMSAALGAARRIMAQKESAKSTVTKKTQTRGTAVAYAPRAQAQVVKAASSEYDDEDDGDHYKPASSYKPAAYDPSLDDGFGKSSRRYKF